MVDQREVVIQFMNENGSVLPIQVAKHLNLDTIFASAILSEMVARKILKITKASIGGSPLYYLPEQAHLMDQRLGESLGGREKQAYELLKESLVVREKNLEPWQRVAIKSLYDFATRIEVNDNGNVDVFWKHNLVSDQQAKLIIQEILDNLNNKEVVSNILTQEQFEQKVVDEPPSQKEIIEEVQITKPEKLVIQEGVVPDPEDIETVEKEEIVEELKLIEEETIQEGINSPSEEEIKEVLDVRKNYQAVQEKLEVMSFDKLKKPDGKFYNQILKFLKDNKADVLHEEMIRKEKEFNFIVDLNTAFGKLRHFVKAKGKASINESDVNAAFGEGKLKNLGVILLVNGKVNKKAVSLVEQRMKGQ